MNYADVRQYLLQKPETIEDFPFGPDAAVFRVHEKVFAILGHRNDVDQVNLKCDPEEALMLRDLFAAVIPGYHMNKKHWNTLLLDKSIPEYEIQRMIDHSFSKVVKGLKKSERATLEMKYGIEEVYRNDKLFIFP